MSYHIYITRTAEKDLSYAADYIDSVLKNPQAADDLLTNAIEQINALAAFPRKFALVDDPVLNAWGIRFVQVKNYLAFYVISEEDRTVYIIRFLYGKRDWISVLRHNISLSGSSTG